MDKKVFNKIMNELSIQLQRIYKPFPFDYDIGGWFLGIKIEDSSRTEHHYHILESRFNSGCNNPDTLKVNLKTHLDVPIPPYFEFQMFIPRESYFLYPVYKSIRLPGDMSLPEIARNIQHDLFSLWD